MGAEKIGSGRRFRVLSQQLAKNRNVKNPNGLAAFIGRKKSGAQRFQQLAQAAKRRGEVIAADAGEPIARRRVKL
jgi:hypothetical protein